MFKIGEIEIHPVNDGIVWLDAGGSFGLVPRKLYSRAFMKPTADNLLPMNLMCLLVKAEGKNILVDTGVGTKLDDKTRRIWGLERPQGGLADGLGRLGLTVDDIDIVINTHLHGDHCAGNTSFSPDGEVMPTFPNARYVVQKQEYEEAMQPNERTRATYFPMNYDPLVKNGQMELLEADETEVVPGVYAVVTAGHTPRHMSVRFESGGEHGIFLCDLATYMPHIVYLGWMTAYDVLPLVTLESKRYWQKWIIENNALMFSSHDTQNPVARLVLDEKGKPALQAVEVTLA